VQHVEVSMSTKKWLLAFCAVQLLGWILVDLRGLLGADEDLIFFAIHPVN